MIEGMNLQEYASQYFYVQLILEVLLLLWTTAQVLVEVFEIADALREHGCMKVGDRSPLLRRVPACVFSRPPPVPLFRRAPATARTRLGSAACKTD